MLKKILFTVAAYVEDRPERWTHVSKTYSKLADGLQKIGYVTRFYVHDKAMHKDLQEKKYTLSSTLPLDKYLILEKPDIVFIWGGRIDADRMTIKIINLFNPSIRIIYSELGWFPQKGSVYFDSRGTNANASFSRDDWKYDSTKKERKAFRRMRSRIIRKDLGLRFYQNCSRFKIAPPDPSKKILVPLQDENDANIIYSSPFKKMKDFIAFLSDSYPTYTFLVRQHPHALVNGLPELPNIEYQDMSTGLFSQFDDIGLVIGINSTVLLQATMHNKTVISVGTGIATVGGCTYSMNVNDPLTDFSHPLIDSKKAENRLAFLLVCRQMCRDKLNDPSYVKNSYLYDLIK